MEKGIGLVIRDYGDLLPWIRENLAKGNLLIIKVISKDKNDGS